MLLQDFFEDSVRTSLGPGGKLKVRCLNLITQIFPLFLTFYRTENGCYLQKFKCSWNWC